MGKLELHFEASSALAPEGRAYIVLGGSRGVDESGNMLLTPDCANLEELQVYVNGFKHDLERILRQAQAKFAKAASEPQKPLFSN